MIYPKIQRLVAAAIWLSMATLVQATPEISLQVVAEKEVTVEEAGEVRIERIETTDAKPGEQLIYTIRYQNTGSSEARSVNLENPIPEGTRYVENSAWGEGAEIFFAVSADSAFKRPAALTYETSEGEERSARPEQYSVIRWVIEEIPAGSAGEAGFSVIVD